MLNHMPIIMVMGNTAHLVPRNTGRTVMAMAPGMKVNIIMIGMAMVAGQLFLMTMVMVFQIKKIM